MNHEDLAKSVADGLIDPEKLSFKNKSFLQFALGRDFFIPNEL